MPEFIENILIGIRLWVNRKLNDITYVISSHVTELHEDVADLQEDISNLADVATSGSYNDLTDKPTIPSPYTLPTASANDLGGVKVGTNLSIDANGVLSADATEFKYTNATAMPRDVGGWTAGSTFSNKSLKDMFDGLLYPYVAPTASISASPSKFEYDSTSGGGTELTFTLTPTAGSKAITSYSIDGNTGETTATKTGTTTDITVSGSVTDGTTTLSPNATAKVSYRCYLGFAADDATAKTNFASSPLYTSVGSIGTKSATGSGNLYFIIKSSWWTNGYTLKSSVGPMSIDSANISTFTHKGLENGYTIVLVGTYSQGTQQFTIQ